MGAFNTIEVGTVAYRRHPDNRDNEDVHSHLDQGYKLVCFSVLANNGVMMVWCATKNDMLRYINLLCYKACKRCMKTPSTQWVQQSTCTA